MNFDKMLITKVLAGDTQAFERLVELHYPKLLGYLKKTGIQTQDAEDLAQEVFIKLFQHLTRYDDRWEFSTWLYRIATNTCKDFYKRAKPKTVPLEEGAALQTDSDFNHIEETESLQSLLSEIQEETRSMMVLHYYNGLSMREIGRLYGISADSVKMRIFRGREKIIRQSYAKRGVS